MSNHAFDISVIIVTYNSVDTISASIEALKVSAVAKPYQLIVVDNGSTDGTIESLRQTAPEALVIENEKNIGFAAACNRGADRAPGANLLFLNPDARLDPDCITRLMKTLVNSPKAGFVVPRLRFPDGRFQASCRHLPTVGNMIFSRGSIFTKLFAHGGRSQTSYTLGDSQQTIAVPAVAGTVALIRRDLFLSFKGFDERFFLYMEDTDLCCRLGQSGFCNLFVPEAGAIHEWGKGSRAGSVVRKYYHHVSVWKYFLKHYPNGFSVFLLPPLLLLHFLISVTLSGFESGSDK